MGAGPSKDWQAKAWSLIDKHPGYGNAHKLNMCGKFLYFVNINVSVRGLWEE
jgi:hypothetical protein